MVFLIIYGLTVITTMVFWLSITYGTSLCWPGCHYELPPSVLQLMLCFRSFSLARGHDGESTFLQRFDGLGRSSQTARVIIVMCSSHLCSVLSSFHQPAGSDFRFLLLD